MRVEPTIKRTVAFIDGQNLYHSARAAFGYTYPNYDVKKLAAAVCASKGWQLVQVRFYTGVPDASDDPRWNAFWIAKLAQMGRDGVHVFPRPLRYRNERVRLADGSEHTVLVGREKGIDVRLALDAIAIAYRSEADVRLIFSQDQDLSELAVEVREIARLQDRWIKIASAFPVSPTVSDPRGINGTDWNRLDRATYDACLDPRDYRPKTKR